MAQQKCLSKLIGYNFIITYKRSKENKVANALSRKLEEEMSLEALLAMISFPTPNWVEELRPIMGNQLRPSSSFPIYLAVQISLKGTNFSKF